MIISSRSLLVLFGVAPAYILVTSDNNTKTLVILVIYASGWIARFFAKSHDPDETILREFFASRTGYVVLALFVISIQLIALHYSVIKALTLAILFVSILFLFWATVNSQTGLKVRFQESVLLIFSLFAFLMILESGLRLAKSNRPINDGATVTWGHEVVTNSLGFREREFITPKPVHTYRIMVLGDSLTWGAGLSTEQRYTNLLQERIDAVFSELKVEVLNFGVSGGPTTMERDILSRYVEKVDPDLILVGFCINDPQPQNQNYATELDSYQFMFNRINDLGEFGLSSTAQMLRERFDQLLRNVGLVPPWIFALDRVYEKESGEWQQFEMALIEIKNISDARSLPPPIFVSLLSFDGNYGKPNKTLQFVLSWSKQAAESAEKYGYKSVDLSTVFALEGEKSRSVNPWDNHPSADTNEVYASVIAPAIIEVIEMSQMTSTNTMPVTQH